MKDCSRKNTNMNLPTAWKMNFFIEPQNHSIFTPRFDVLSLVRIVDSILDSRGKFDDSKALGSLLGGDASPSRALWEF